MRLSKIRLSGFKSFVDATTILFPSNLTGIVGPNGCGKSNVIDAIRWVLGEASAKTLRGDSMADVIFNGSAGRKPVGQASVELIFDNADGTITGPYAGYSEVSVRRVVARDGTSLYFLNNGRCRRKDITHILLGTGLGSHGYSIIEQGMISRLVEAKPEELRAFIEEAAGISKYKERRRETEHRIRHTRENLERLKDLREEIDKQISHLHRQAKAAERYKELKADERRVGAEVLVLRLRELRAEVDAHEKALKEKQRGLDEAVTNQGSIETEIEKHRVAMAERNEAFNTVQGSYYRVGAEIARLEQGIQHRKSLMQRQRSDLEETSQQLAEVSGHIASDRIEIEQLEALLEELNPNLEETHRRLRASERVLEDSEKRMELARASAERNAQEIATTERTVQVEDARIEQLAAQLERLQRGYREQVSERETVSSAGLESAIEKLAAREEKLRADTGTATRTLESIWERMQELRVEESTASATLDELRAKLQNDRGRLSSLQALQEAALGKLSQQVGGWLERHSLNDRPRLAQTLEVESGWETAVETVLDGYLQAVTVPNLGALAKDLASIRAAGIAVIEESGAKSRANAAGKVGWLGDRVKAPAAAVALVSGIRTAESLADALRQRATLAENESVITRDGVWIGLHWLRIHKSDDPQMGVLVRSEEIERLEQAIAATTAGVEEASRTLASVRDSLEDFEKRRAAAQLVANEKQQAYAEARTKLEANRAHFEETRKRAKALEASISGLATDQRTIEAALLESRKQLRDAKARRADLEREREVLDRERRSQQDELAQARKRAENDRAAAQEIAIQVETRRSSKESASAALTRIQTQHQHLLKRQTELKAQLEATVAPLQSEEHTLVEKLDERLTVEGDLSRARGEVEQCETLVRDAEVRRGDQQKVVAEAREGVEGVRMSAREAQVRAETVAEQFGKTGFELDALSSGLPEAATITEWTERLDQIDKRVQRLGAINLAAIEEYAEQSQRKEYLDKQFADLTEALETLENAIRKIDRETRARFKETFDNANQGLGRIFPRLFGGGHAYLELDSEDLLSAGVTIMARPPGKKISTIHLMSGGEKALTAVALVFSIFELNPAPFCLLDEVDAPLDDANVGRFSEIVREMSGRVQFVLITHNKTTMEAMNQLAGVTMQEPGVSRLVAVDIDEAVQLAAM
jgi:chromosome segregation protein